MALVIIEAASCVAMGQWERREYEQDWVDVSICQTYEGRKISERLYAPATSERGDFLVAATWEWHDGRWERGF